MSDHRLIIARAHAELGEKYRVSIDADGHRMVADEPVRVGGSNAGPAPYDLLLAGLAACTSITLRMYAERKQWPLEGVAMDLTFSRHEDEARIDRQITVTGPLTDEQRVRLAEIAERTPVTLTIKSGVPIQTELKPG